MSEIWTANGGTINSSGAAREGSTTQGRNPPTLPIPNVD